MEIRVSEAEARRLNNGRLPRDGHEALVWHDGRHWWLARRREGWTVRDAGKWRLVNGEAVLGG